MSIGMPEILIVLFIVLLLFGPKRLPELSRAVGRSVGEFKRAMNEMQEQIESAASEASDEVEKAVDMAVVEETLPDEKTSPPAAPAAEEPAKPEAPVKKA